MFRKIIKGLKDVWCGTLEFDTEPKKDSFNPVTSGGVYDAINGAGGAKEIVYFDVDPSDPPSGIYEAIGEALANNKEPVIKNDGAVYFYSSTGTDKYIFVGGYDTDVVNYTTVTVSDNDSVVKETVDTIEGMVFPLYYHSNDGGFTVADKTGHALTKTEIADAYRAGQIFMFSSYPASNTQAHWGYCCDINIDSDNTGYAEFFILAAFGGDSYEWEKYRINLSSGTEFVTLWGPNTSYSTGYSGYYADGATTVSVSTTQNFNSTQKAKGRDNIGAASASDVTALQSQVSSLSDVSAYSVKGEATVAQLNAGPSGIQAGWAYQLTDSGTLTDGTLAVVAGDTVAWDGTKWFPLVKSDYYATKTYAQNVAASIAPPFDPTRDYVVGESCTYEGTAYIFTSNHPAGAWNPAHATISGQSALLRLTAQNARDSKVFAYEVPAGGVIAYMPSQNGSHFVCSYRYNDSAKGAMATGYAMVTYTAAEVVVDSFTYRNINYIQSPSALECPLKMLTDGTRVVVVNNLSVVLQVSFISCAGNWNYPNDSFSYPSGWVSESAVEVGIKNPVMPLDRVHSSKVRNGGVGNSGNPNKVTSTCVYCDPNYTYVVYIDRPLQTGHRYEFGYSLSSDVNDVGRALKNNSPSKIVTVDSPKYKVGDAISFKDYPAAKAVCIEINEFDENNTVVPLRQADFFGYSITLIPVQNAELNYVLDETLDYSLINAIARLNVVSNGSKDFCALIVTDSHNDVSSVARAIGYSDKSVATSCAVHCGDYVGSYVQYGQNFTDWAASVNKSIKPVFFVQGNHEKGTFYSIRMTPSDATLYNLFVKPIVDKGYLSLGEYEVGKCYYYHDFSLLKTRLIVVDEYRAPTDYLETYWHAIAYDSTLPNISNNTSYSVGDKVNIPGFTDNSFQAVQDLNTGAYYSGFQPSYRCRRGYRYIDQTEAQWFLDTLYSTPSDYVVVVAMHNPFSDLATPDKTKKFCQKQYIADNITGADWAQNYMATDFVANALNAYKTGTSYSETISTKSGTEADYIADYSVAKDFSIRGEGKLGLIIGGHVHRDVVWKHPTYTYMYQVTPMCSVTTSRDNNWSADIRLQNDTSFEKYIDSLTAFAVADGRTALAKLGCKYTTDARVRDIEVL